jgi:membrane protease subunit (stomatin/prohibitin family)
MIVRRRGMPLIRGALIGGVAYGVGRRVTAGAQREQQQSAAIADLQSQQAYPAAAAAAQAPPADVTTRLTQLSELLQQGALTQEEFVQAKAKVLAG